MKIGAPETVQVKAQAEVTEEAVAEVEANQVEVAQAKSLNHGGLNTLMTSKRTKAQAKGQTMLQTPK